MNKDLNRLVKSATLTLSWCTCVNKSSTLQNKIGPREHQPVTVSIAIGSSSDINRGEVGLIIEQADQARYRAKHNGGNRTDIWHCNKSLYTDAAGVFCPLFNADNLAGNLTGNPAPAERA